LNYALVGHGRMGRAVGRQADARGHRRVAVFDPEKGDATLDPRRMEGAGLAFEFTVPDAAEGNVCALLEAGISVVSGTTGWEPSASLRKLAERGEAAFVLAPNFSIGVHLFFRIAEQAARTFGVLGLHDPFIQEEHHRGKIDAPSGTARRLAALVVDADPRLDGVVEGHPSAALPPGKLQVVSTRAGTETGTHRIGFDGLHDLVTIEHRARGREGFALGAVLTAEWLEGRSGNHGFDEVLEAILRGEIRAEGEIK